MEDKRWKEDEIIENLRKAGESEPIPKSLQPDQIEKRLKEADAKKEKGKKKRSYKWWYGTAAAACFAIVLLTAGKNNFPNQEGKGTAISEETEKADGKETDGESGTTYEKLYQSFSKLWKEEDKFTYKTIEKSEEQDIVYDAVEESAGMQRSESLQEDSSAAKTNSQQEKESKDYGKTNQQEAEVEEADIIKNDGRYLYQVIQSEKNYKDTVQIADTQNGLKETSRVGEFDNIQDIYIWKDKLVVLESCFAYAEDTKNEQDARSGNAIPLCDVAYIGNAFTRIHIYDMENRAKPKERHTFTVRGDYRDSRISDGYLYFFARDYAGRPENPEDYKSYIPLLDDQPIKEECIYLPKDAQTDSYLVLVSINMERPDKFTDTKAIVTDASQFYVSRKNIYVTDTRYPEHEKEGENSNSTKIYRFSYEKGSIKKEAEGSVKGILRDDMAMNEYNGYLRMVTTVDTYQVKKVKDDIFHWNLGYETTDHETSNSLYVLDKNLKVSGKIENLAKEERIYSARFMGDTGYFVTFRQTDPLFSVDLSNPKQPKILGELKISGFSEYLHFYADNLLFGIGMEADEENGRTEGMKLSMFNIQNPSDVKEEAKLDLSEYKSARALYDYKAVLIDTQKNLFGFLAESYGENEVCDYLLFSYDNGEFQQKMKIDCTDDEKYAGEIRGTYIGDSFYLLCQNGRIEEYSLKGGNKIRELEP